MKSIMEVRIRMRNNMKKKSTVVKLCEKAIRKQRDIDVPHKVFKELKITSDPNTSMVMTSGGYFMCNLFRSQKGGSAK